MSSILLTAGLLLCPLEQVLACALNFTSPQRGSTLFTSVTNISGTGSGTANAGAYGTVTATINGSIFFQRSGRFNSLIDFFGSGTANVNLKEGANFISVNGSAAGCSASDSMVVYYEPPITDVDKNTGPPQCSTGNPINTATGNKYQREVDYSGSSLSPSYSRTYNSDLASLDFGMGYGWKSVSVKRIIRNGNKLVIRDSSGKSQPFTQSGTTWQGDSDSQLILEENSIGFIVKKPWNETEQYNTLGQLISTTNRQQQSTQYGYDSYGLMNSNTGPFGQTITLNYRSDGRLTQMTDPEDHRYRYSYDGKGNLTTVTYPDDTPLDDSDNPTRIYHYENTAFPHHLTGITDENGVRFATWAYDSEGRAISSEHAGSVEKETLDFSTPDQVTVTNPLGKQTTYHFTTLHGVKKVTQVEGHATASCVGANQNYTYDANGYIASKTDWQGNVRSYVHDARGLEISRTEAYGTPEARTITTEWHADFRLPVKITEPNQVTDFIYDVQGRLLSKTTESVQP